MMTSSNGSIFRVTGPLRWEFAGPGEFPTQRPVTRSFHAFFDLRLNKRLSKQPPGWSQGGCRAVAMRSATNRRPVADGCRDDLLTRRFWLLQVKPLCYKIDRKKVLVVADRSPTGWRLIAEQLQRLQTIPTQFLVADQSPIGCRPISKTLHTFCSQKQTLKIQSPTSRRPIAKRLPIPPQLIADWSPTGRPPLSDYTTTRSLSAPEPMLDLFSVSSSDINLNAISWRQFYKRYFNHRSLKLACKLLIWYLFKFDYTLPRFKYMVLIYV